MHEFKLTGVENASFDNVDRTKLTIRLRTEQGLLALDLQADHLDSMISLLQSIEYSASLLDSAKGQLPGEAGQIRSAVVDHHQVGHGLVNGVSSALVGLKSGGVLRWFAFDKTKAEALREALTAEIPKLDGRPN
jgi:hypothetical protein